jgi:hypothetical protein
LSDTLNETTFFVIARRYGIKVNKSFPLYYALRNNEGAKLKNYETRKKALRHKGFSLFLTPSALSVTALKYHAVANCRGTSKTVRAEGVGVFAMTNIPLT